MCVTHQELDGFIVKCLMKNGCLDLSIITDSKVEW